MATRVFVSGIAKAKKAHSSHDGTHHRSTFLKEKSFMPVPKEVIDTITDAWTVSAAESLNAYNDILSFDGQAKNIRTVPVTEESVKALAAVSPFAGQSLANLVRTVFQAGIVAEMVQCVDEGMKKGWGYKKIVDALKKDAIDKGFSFVRSQCITLSRSYVQQASVNAQMAVYQRNSDVVKGVKWTAILDNRVCGKCAALDGKTYAWDEQRPKMIAHPRCRCLWLPWLKSFRDLGIDIDDVEEAARPWLLREKGNIDEGGKRKILEAGTTKENFGGWWKTLPYEEQVRSIGPTRTRLINEGKIKWEDLIDRETGRFRTLKELNALRDKENYVTTEAINWLNKKIDNIKKGKFLPKCDSCKIGTVDDIVLNFLKRKGIKLESSDIILNDSDFYHAMRDVKPNKIPAEIWVKIPQLLKDPSGVYWNIKKKAVLYTIEDEQLKAKIIVQPNHDMKFSTIKDGKRKRETKIVNNLRTGSIVPNWSEFENRGNYEKIK